MGNSFPKRERLTRKSEFELLLSEGKITRDRILRLHYSPSNQTYSSLGIAVPKRRIKKACERNLIKRRIREIYRTHKPINTHYKMLCIYNQDTVCTFQELEHAFRAHLQQVCE